MDDVQLLRADPSSSEDEHFRIMLVQTEVERVKFVIRSYIRTRLHKVRPFYDILAASCNPRTSYRSKNTRDILLVRPSCSRNSPKESSTMPEGESVLCRSTV